MKKSKTLVLGMTLAMLLSGCNGGGGGGKEKTKTFSLTFHQATVEDTVYTVTQGVTKNSDIVEPEIVNQLEGYTYYWEYDVESMTADLTIEPSKSAIEYTATFVEDDGETVVATVPFTVEDSSIEEPAVPSKKGYSGEWEEYTLSASDITIEPEYTLQTYTVTFTINGEAYGSAQTFCVLDLDENNHLPATLFPEYSGLPQTLLDDHPYKDPKWNDPAIETMGDVTIELGWVDHLYEIEFQNEDGEVVATKTYTYNGSQASNIEEPAVPEKTGYTGTWNYVPNASAQTIVVKPTYEATKYIATFVNAQGATVGTVEYTIETISIEDQEPAVPTIEGMDGEWEDYTLTPGGITIKPTYVNHRYYIEYQVDGETIEGGTIWYDKDTESYASLEKPAVPEKTGYTGSWDDAEVILTHSDTHIIINAIYTAKEYKVTLPNGDVLTVTYGSTYDLSSKADYFNQLYYGDELVPLKGTYDIADDIVLTAESTRFGFEDFERVESLNGLLNLSKTNVSKVEVKNGVGVNGSRGLEVTGFYGDKGLYFSKTYLDLVFAKSSIAGLNFDFKGEVQSNNFRHRSYTHNAAGAVQTNQDGSPKAANITYYMDNGQNGLQTYWQTAQFTRAMYEELCENPSFDGGFVVFGTTGNAEKTHIWIDNIKPVNYDLKTVDTSKAVNFDSGMITGLGTNDHFIKDVYTQKTILQVFDSNGGSLPNESKMEFDTTIKTQGHSSLHIMRNNGELDLGLHNDIVDPAIAAGYTGIEFDIMVDHAVGPGNAKWFSTDNSTGRGTSSSTNFTGCELYVVNTWYTLRVPFEHVRDNTMNYFFQLQNNGGDSKEIHNVWIDNIHPYKESLSVGENLIESFENSNVKKILNMKTNGELDSVYWEAGSRDYTYPGVDIPVPTKANYRDCNKGMDVYTNLWFLTSRSDLVSGSRCVGSIDNEHASEGTFSFKLEVTPNDGAPMINGFIQKSLMNKLAPGDKVLLDVYTDVENAKFGGRATGGAKTATNLVKDQWTTVEWVFSDGDTNFFRINEGSLPKGSFWFDNLRVVKA